MFVLTTTKNRKLVFGTLFDRIGYNAISNEMFRNIVICRLFNPGSKLETVDYLERYLHVSYSVGTGANEEHVCHHLRAATIQTGQKGVPRHGRGTVGAMQAGGAGIGAKHMSDPTQKTGQERGLHTP